MIPPEESPSNPNTSNDRAARPPIFDLGVGTKIVIGAFVALVGVVFILVFFISGERTPQNSAPSLAAYPSASQSSQTGPKVKSAAQTASPSNSTQPSASESLEQSDLIITDMQAAPVEYQLAYLDSNHLPRGTDVHAARIRYLLRSLAQATGKTPAQISDRTTRCTTLLKRDYGKAVTNERFLEEANSYCMDRRLCSDFDQASALLVVVMGQ